VESAFTFTADNIFAFSAANQFCDFLEAIGFLLLADSGNWHTATNSFDLRRDTYSCYWFHSDKPISAISRLASRY
jgi:hypothetical protein